MGALESFNRLGNVMSFVPVSTEFVSEDQSATLSVSVSGQEMVLVRTGARGSRKLSTEAPEGHWRGWFVGDIENNGVARAKEDVRRSSEGKVEVFVSDSGKDVLSLDYIRGFGVMIYWTVIGEDHVTTHRLDVPSKFR